MKPITTIIADSQTLFAEGLENVLSNLTEHRVIVIEKVQSAKQLFEKLRLYQADLVLLDINFQDMDGMEIISHLKNEFEATKVCVVSSYTDSKFVKAAFLSGAHGFYSKFNDSEELNQCLNKIMLGNTFLSEGLFITPPQKNRLNGSLNGKRNHMQDRFILQQKLTKREQEVLSLITKALNNKEIAKELYISHQTVGVHRKNIMRKLGVKNTVNLIRFALDNQLI